MKVKIAVLVSFLFNPLFLSFLVPFLIVYRYTGSGFTALKWLLFSSIFAIMATSYLFYGRIRGYFSDLDISKREERPRYYKILLFLAILYLAISLLLKGYFFPISIFSFGSALAIISYLLVNRYIKASGHVGVASAFVILIGVLYGRNVFIATVWILPLLAWSRITLKKHTMREVLAGAALGLVVSALTYIIGTVIY